MAEHMLSELNDDSLIGQHVSQLKQLILEQKKTGMLVVVDGKPETIKNAFIAQLAVNELSEQQNITYTCLSFFLDDECYSGISKNEVIAQLNLKQPIELNIEESLDELILEAEYSYKKLGMSRHMSWQVKQQFRLKLAYQTAEMMALDMNLYLAT